MENGCWNTAPNLTKLTKEPDPQKNAHLLGVYRPLPSLEKL